MSDITSVDIAGVKCKGRYHDTDPGVRQNFIVRLAQKALPRLNKIDIDHAAHTSPAQGMCIMESVAYISGQGFTDHPICVSEVITTFLIAINDTRAGIDDETGQVSETNEQARHERNKLKEVVPEIIGTAPTKVEWSSHYVKRLDRLVEGYWETADITEEYLDAELRRIQYLSDKGIVSVSNLLRSYINEGDARGVIEHLVSNGMALRDEGSGIPTEEAIEITRELIAL